MGQSKSRGKRVWFWVGVVLLSISALWWLLMLVSVEDKGDAVFTAVMVTIIPVGVGIYGIRRGRRAQAVEMQQIPKDITDTGSKVVIKMPWWFVLGAWFCLILLPVAVWMLGMTTKVVFDKPPGYMTVTRGHIPLFMWFLRTKVISKEEARRVFVYTREASIWEEGYRPTYEVRVTTRSGNEVILYKGGYRRDKVDYLATRIKDFAQEAGT